MSLLRRKPDPAVEAERDALWLRVHGRAGTCWACGLATHVASDAPEVHRDGIDGRRLSFVTCAACVPLLDARRLDRTIIGMRLGIDPDNELLATVTVPTFADEPLAVPTRPNTVAWGHVDDRQLALAVSEAKARLDAATTDPCTMCGITVRVEGFARSDEGWCHSCDYRLNRMFSMPDGRRDLAASVLMGIDDQGAPVGIGARVGLRWWCELPERQRLGSRKPFAWIGRDTVKAWCVEEGQSPERVFRFPW